MNNAFLKTKEESGSVIFTNTDDASEDAVVQDTAGMTEVGLSEVTEQDDKKDLCAFSKSSGFINLMSPFNREVYHHYKKILDSKEYVHEVLKDKTPAMIIADMKKQGLFPNKHDSRQSYSPELVARILCLFPHMSYKDLHLESEIPIDTLKSWKKRYKQFISSSESGQVLKRTFRHEVKEFYTQLPVYGRLTLESAKALIEEHKLKRVPYVGKGKKSQSYAAVYVAHICRILDKYPHPYVIGNLINVPGQIVSRWSRYVE